MRHDTLCRHRPVSVLSGERAVPCDCDFINEIREELIERILDMAMIYDLAGEDRERNALVYTVRWIREHNER